jgi:energy-coupling factor transport system permease protein
VHPLLKLVVCLGWVIALILVFDARFQLIGLAGAALALVLFGQVRVLLVLALAVPFALFGFGFLMTSLLFREEGGYALQVAGEAAVSAEALQSGIVLFLRALSCGMVSALFVLTTDPGALVKAAMRDWRLPPRVGYALFSVLHVVPDLVSELHQIRLARAMKQGAPLRRMPGPVEAGSLFVPLLAYAIRRATRAAIAMEARGLEAGAERTILGAPRFARHDLIFLAIGLGALSAALLLILYYRSQTE